MPGSKNALLISQVVHKAGHWDSAIEEHGRWSDSGQIWLERRQELSASQEAVIPQDCPGTGGAGVKKYVDDPV
jgi:hypothetical protein